MSKPIAIDYSPKVKGLSIIDTGPGAPGARYMARAFDSANRKQVSKKWDTIPQCINWAETKLAAFKMGLDCGGRVLLKDILEPFIESKQGDADYIAGIRALLEEAIAWGISDLKSKSIIRDTQKFLNERKSHKITSKCMVDGKVVHQPLPPSTFKKFRGYFVDIGNFCCHPGRNWMVRNPFEALTAPRLPEKIPAVFWLPEIAKLVCNSALLLEEGLYWAFRFYTGMRGQEVAKLRWEHIQWDNKRIYVKVEIGKKLKRSKERTVILQDELIALLREHAAVQGEFVFSDRIRTRKIQSDWRACQKHLKRCGVTMGDRKPHSLRATCASMLLATGLDQIQLQMHLGHSSLKQTSDYAKAAPFFQEQVREWGGRIRVREKLCGMGSSAFAKCDKSANGATNHGVVRDIQEAEAPSPEDEIDDCIIAIIPDNSPIWAEVSGQANQWYTIPALPARTHSQSVNRGPNPLGSTQVTELW